MMMYADAVRAVELGVTWEQLRRVLESADPADIANGHSVRGKSKRDAFDFYAMVVSGNRGPINVRAPDKRNHARRLYSSDFFIARDILQDFGPLR